MKTEDASIFFRKQSFISDLNLESRKVVNQFEELKLSLEAISNLAGIKRERLLPIFSTEDDPNDVALALSKQLYPAFERNKRDFLKALINRFAEYNILVFEFIETWNKKENANIDGFFLRPNVIVLKRQQNAFSREIFTLIHELGHYLLNIEEVEQIDVLNLSRKELSAVERWCNNFAFYFLAGDRAKEISELGRLDERNDYHFDNVTRISNETHLSKLAIYTRLLFNDQISQTDYNQVRSALEEQVRLRQEEKERQKENDKMLGAKIKGTTLKPINSPLLISTVQIAYYEGIMNEADVCKTLKITSEKMLGSAIWNNLTAKGYTNLVGRNHQELDLMDGVEVAHFFAEERPEYVFLAAAHVGGIMANNTYRADFIYRNLQIQNKVIGTGDRGYPPEIWHHRKPADSLGNGEPVAGVSLERGDGGCLRLHHGRNHHLLTFTISEFKSNIVNLEHEIFGI